MFALPLGPDAVLKPLERWHAGEFAAHIERARDHLRPWIPFASRVIDEASAAAFLQDWAERQFNDTGRCYGIWVGDVLSGGTLFRFHPFQVCEIGVWLDPAAQGKGLIQAAATHMIDWAFRERGMLRVEWLCSDLNTRSKAAALRLGLTYEGTMRSNFVADGVRQHSEIYAILPDEWLARTGSTTVPQIVQLLASPIHRYEGRPADGPAPAPPGELVDAVEIRAGLGIVGDRYFGHPAHRNAQVTLIAEESVPPGADLSQVRRNILLRGIAVDGLIGSVLTLDSGDGPIRFKLHRPANPCAWMDATIGAGARDALKGKGGVRCEPLDDGTLRVGPVSVVVES